MAVGYYLGQLSRSFLILDANERPGDSWRQRWDSLQLFTPAYLSDLPGLDFPGPRTRCPSKDEMANYLETYAARFDLPIRSFTRVQSVTKIKNGFLITADDCRFEADNVVLATGGYQAPYVQTSQTSSTPASCSCTPANTGDLSSWARVMCWLWAPPTREPRSRSRLPRATEPGSPARTRATSPPDQAAGSTGF